MFRRRKACASELNASLLERFTTSAAKFRRKQTALTRAVLLITNKRSTLCVLSLVFAVKCSHKLGELPAGVRGMSVVLFYLFQVCFSQLFDGQKVAKSPGTRENQSAGSLFASRKRHPSVEPALSLRPLPSVAGCCGTCFARLFREIYTRANLQTVLTQWPATEGPPLCFSTVPVFFDVTLVSGNVRGVVFLSPPSLRATVLLLHQEEDCIFVLCARFEIPHTRFGMTGERFWNDSAGVFISSLNPRPSLFFEDLICLLICLFSLFANSLTLSLALWLHQQSYILRSKVSRGIYIFV